jgi:hypothetical protein
MFAAAERGAEDCEWEQGFHFAVFLYLISLIQD